jgi:hypothetical protein
MFAHHEDEDEGDAMSDALSISLTDSDLSEEAFEDSKVCLLKRWYRCDITKVSLATRVQMSPGNWDSLLFTPQRKVHICGFGVFGPTDATHGWSLKFRWKIEDNMNDTYIFRSSDSTVEHNLNKTHRVVFSEHNAPDFVVKTGVKFHLMIASDEGPLSDYRFLNLGSRRDLFRQTSDFKVEPSSYNSDPTRTSGQLPYLLY